MSATASDARALGARLRTLTLGRLGAVVVLGLYLATIGRGLVDAAGTGLLLATAAAHVTVNVAQLLAPTPSRRTVRWWLHTTTVVDAWTVGVALAVTGGITSPLVPLLYAEAAAVTLAFGLWAGVRSSTLLTLAMLWVLGSSPPSLDRVVASAADADPTLGLALTPSVRAGLLVAALWFVTILVSSISRVTEAEMRHWLHDLERLRKVSHRLDPGQKLTDVCDALADALVSAGDYRDAVVWLSDGERLVATGSAALSVAARDALDRASLTPSDALVSRAVAGGGPLPVRRSEARPESIALVQGSGTPLVVVPIGSQEQLVGVITATVISPTVGPPRLPGRELRWLELLATEASLLLRNCQLQEELRALAITDALTGLPNHGFFQRRLAEELERIARRQDVGDQRSLSVALFDLDHFKAINDTYGHPAGDAVLSQVARVAAETLRPGDVVCRYGGEEFAAVLTDTSHTAAVRACERLRDAISGLRIRIDDGRVLRVTASFGVATTVGDTLDRPGLISAADRALYAAKRQGRDRVVHADASTSDGSAPANPLDASHRSPTVA